MIPPPDLPEGRGLKVCIYCPTFFLSINSLVSRDNLLPPGSSQQLGGLITLREKTRL